MASTFEVQHPPVKTSVKGTDIIVESPGNVEMGGKIDRIELYVDPTWKTILRYTSYLCTAGIMYLFNIWIIRLHILMSLSKTDLQRATRVVVIGADKSVEIVPLDKETTSKNSYKVFSYRLFKYYYDEESGTFKACQFRIDRMSANQIHEKYGQGSDEKDVQDSTIFFGKNLTDIPKKSCIQLLFQEVLSPFYIFQIYSFVVWSIDDYFIYAVMICFFSVISITFTLYETLQTTNKLRKMSYYEIQVNVFRKVNGEPKKMNLNSSELVPGDLIEIPEGVMMPCDAILLNGSCIMNEAMLTGESIPVIKNSLPYNNIYYDPKEDKQYTLFAGTKCIQARFYQGNAVLGLVTLTGFGTVKGELIRTMLFPKPSDFKFYSDSFRFIGILAIMALAGFAIDLPAWLNPPIQPDATDGSDAPDASDNESMLEIIIIKASEIVTVTVPPALPTCMQVGISVALTRLKKRQTFCISPTKINEAGRVNVMCFDKTGTLTEEGLDLLGVRPVFLDKNNMKWNFAKLVKDVTNLAFVNEKTRDRDFQDYVKEAGSDPSNLYKKSKQFPSEQMLEILATCHSLTLVDGKMIGDPLDLKMFECTKWELEENDQNKFDPLVMAVIRPPQSQIVKETSDSKGKKEVGIIRRFEFSSKLQRMSTVVKNLEENAFKIHIKGSPEKIRELCKPDTIPANFHKVLEKYTENGYRVLSCATKTTKMNYQQIMAAEREDVENNFTFIGYLIMENRLKPVTTEIIKVLHDAKIRTIMVTGDNALTAISVARQCGIVGQHQRLFLGDMSEQKVNGKDVILWKDFDFNDRVLNNNLEVDEEAEEKLLSSFDKGLGPRPMRMTEKRTRIESKTANEIEKYKGRLSLKENLLTDPSYQIDVRSNRGSTITQKNIIASSGNIVEMEIPFSNLTENDNYCLAVSGKAFSHILREANEKKNVHYQFILQKMLRKCLVFARMHPDEKALMIQKVKELSSNNIVGMCGDGANDVGALKTANVGVSLSEAEASIAAPFTSNIQDISCIPNLLKEGRAALSTSYQAFKYMALYSIIQFTSVTILYHQFIDMTNWQYYHIDIMIILPLSGTMAMTQTYEHLTVYKPTGRLVSVQILTSVLGQGVIQILFQVGVFMLLTHQGGTDYPGATNTWIDNFNTANANSSNTTMYLFSIFQYTVMAIAFMVGRPFRKSFYTNYWFTGFFCLLICVNTFMVFDPFHWGFLTSETIAAEYSLSFEWRRTIMYIALINAAVIIFWERIVVKNVSSAWKNYRDRLQEIQDEKESSYQNPRPISIAKDINKMSYVL